MALINWQPQCLAGLLTQLLITAKTLNIKCVKFIYYLRTLFCILFSIFIFVLAFFLLFLVFFLLLIHRRKNVQNFGQIRMKLNFCGNLYSDVWNIFSKVLLIKRKKFKFFVILKIIKILLFKKSIQNYTKRISSFFFLELIVSKL